MLVQVLHSAQASRVEFDRFHHDYELSRSLDPSLALAPQDLIRTNSHLFTVYAPFAGHTLEEIATGDAVTSDHWLAIARAITTQLNALHQQGIIHRNLHPGSILLTPETHEVRFIDFRIATVLSGLRTRPGQFEGHPSYISPEQTGRTRIPIQPATDQYGLGGCLYFLATQCAPFLAEDDLGLVHAHLALSPRPFSSHEVSLHGSIEAIVSKLLGKRPIDRYRSLDGLLADLDHLITQGPLDDQTPVFQPGKQDPSQHFVVPDTVYGRTQQRTALHDSCKRCLAGAVETVYVTGDPGIGKSTIVMDLLDDALRANARFLSGKFDQFRRGIPFAAASQISDDLTRSLATEKPEVLAELRERISEALGDHQSVLLEILPDLVFLIGEQPPPPEVGATEAQARFQESFRQFTRIIATKERPILLFLDDVQWADPASCSLVQHLLTDPHLKYFHFICAYRHGEVDAEHQAIHMLEGIKDHDVPCTRIHLDAMTPEDVATLLSDSLAHDGSRTQELASWVHRKTRGNPFFVIEFLRNLHDTGHLRFESFGWHWNMEDVQRASVTDNVVTMVTTRMRQLPSDCMSVLRTGACMGRSINVNHLLHLEPSWKHTVDDSLKTCVEAGLLEPLLSGQIHEDHESAASHTHDFRFVHDRVQQAAYELLNQSERAAIHAKLGRMLLAHAHIDTEAKQLFHLCDHLNHGKAHLSSQELKHLLHFNLLAAKRAKEATAYRDALRYLDQARSLTPSNLQESDRDLFQRILRSQADCEYLIGEFEAAEANYNTLLQLPSSPFDRAQVLAAKMTLLDHIGRYDDTIDCGLEALECLGQGLPRHPSQVTILTELAKALLRLQREDIAKLADHPPMEGKEDQLAVEVLQKFFASAYFRNQELLALGITRMVNLSLKKGNTPSSALAYAFFGMILGSQLGAHKRGGQFGELAIAVNEKFDDAKFRAQTLVIAGSLVLPWTRPLNKTLPILYRAINSGMTAGDLMYAGYAASLQTIHRLVQGVNLTQVIQSSRDHVAMLRRIQYPDNLYYFLTVLRAAHHLIGRELDPSLYTERERSTEHFRDDILQIGRERVAMVYNLYCVFEEMQAYLLGDLKTAEEHCRTAEENIALSIALPQTVEHAFWTIMTFAVTDARHSRKLLQKLRKRLETWAKFCPENIEHKYLLADAELHRAAGKPDSAGELYQKALNVAKRNQCLYIEALACERLGDLLLRQKDEPQARSYLEEACTHYRNWGADAVVERVRKQYADLLRDPSHTSSDNLLVHAASSHLDLAALMKASRAISGEIELEHLLKKLLQILMENAGATQGHLLDPRTTEPTIIASGQAPSNYMVHPTAITMNGHLAASVVYTALHTGAPVIVNQAVEEDTHGADPYVQTHQCQSILCLPVRHENKLTALIYLENTLTPEAFTHDRTEFVQLLASQAAISMAHARLYQETRQLQLDFQGLIDHAPAAVFVHKEGKVVYLNEQACHHLGHSSSKALENADLLNMVTAADRGLAEQLLAGKSNTHSREIRFHTEEGAIRIMEVTAVENISFGGSIANMWLAQDITPRRKLEQEVVQASTTEQERIAHDLHDGVGQILAALCLQAKLLEKNIELGNTPNAGQARALIDLANQAADQTRALARGLDPVELERDGLNSALQGLAERSRELLRIECTFLSPQFPKHITKFNAIHLYRIAQEAVNNAVRHGNASRVIIALSQSATETVLEIRDNGSGVPEGVETTKGTGLRNMHHRARVMGGDLQLQTADEGGLRLTCRVMNTYHEEDSVNTTPGEHQ